MLHNFYTYSWNYDMKRFSILIRMLIIKLQVWVSIIKYEVHSTDARFHNEHFCQLFDGLLSK